MGQGCQLHAPEARLEAAGAQLFGDSISLDLRYDRDVVIALSGLGGRFDARRKRWIVPRHYAAQVADLLQLPDP